MIKTKTQSRNKKMRTDFINSIEEKDLTDRQLKSLWRDPCHHFRVGTQEGVWDTKKQRIVKTGSIIVDFTTRKKNFYTTWDNITLIENVKGNIIVSTYRVGFRYNPETMKVERVRTDIFDINVVFKDKPKVFFYSKTMGFNALASKFSERANDRYHMDKIIYAKPFNLRQSVFKGTKFEYIDVPKLMKTRNIKMYKILSFHNLPMLERAVKEGWSHIALQTYNEPSIPEQFQLPRFSKKQIWEMVDFYKTMPSFNLRIYKDYIELGYKLRKTFGPKRYLEHQYPTLHDRYVNEQRRINIREQKDQDSKRIFIQKWWKKHQSELMLKDVKVNKIKSPEDSNEFGTFMANCMGQIHKDWKNDFAVQIKDQWVACWFDQKEDRWQILGFKNLTLPSKVIALVKKAVIKYKNKEVANAPKQIKVRTR